MKRLMILALAMLMGQSVAWAGDWFPIGPRGRGGAPPAIEGHSMVTLPDGRVLLFGGEDAEGTLFNDLYAIDNGGWAKITPRNSPPPPRDNHQAWVNGDQMYIYGGLGNNNVVLDDLWDYDPMANTWNQIMRPTGPAPVARQGHSVTTLADGSVLIVGGTDANGNPLRDAWKLNTNNNTYTQLPDAPIPFNESCSELVVNGDWMLVFGKPGSIGIYRVGANIWSLVSGGPPNGEGCSTSKGTNAAGEPVIFIFGGKDANGNETSDVYKYDVYSGQLTQEESMPQPVVNGAVAKLSSGGLPQALRLTQQQSSSISRLMFGGLSGGVPTGNTYLFSPFPPSPDIKANNSDGPVTIASNSDLSITVSLNAANRAGENADWWVAAKNSSGEWFHYNLSGSWLSGLSPTYQGPLINVNTTLLNTQGMPPGTYTIYIAVDMNMNGSVDTGAGQFYYDSVLVNGP